jgi:hypothetical protein
MKRAAYVFAIVSVLLFADGIYLQVSNNQQGCGCQGDSGTLFGGSTSIAISTGMEVIICAAFLLIVAVVIWIWATLRARGRLSGANGAASQAQAATAPAATAPAAKAPAAQAPTAKAPAAKAQASHARAAQAQVGQSPAKTEVTAGQGQPGKESGDQG